MPFEHIAVVLVAPRNPLNIGAVARAMSNFGFADLRIAGAHAPNVEEARSAVDAAPLLAAAKVFATTVEAIADCHHVIGTTTGKARSLPRPLVALPDAAELFRQSGNTALLFGSEKHGLTAEDLSLCTALVHIPTRAEHLSMNLGQAAAICLYAIATMAGHADGNATAEIALATFAERELLFGALVDSLTIANFGGASDSATLRNKARQMIANMHLTTEDARLLLSMVRKLAVTTKTKEQ